MKAYAVCALCVGLLLTVPSLVIAADSKLADAAKQQDRTAVRTLLKQGVSVNAPQADGATALHWAAHWNDVEMADLLLKARANANAKNDYEVTPLLLAVENGSDAMVQRLLKAGANTNAAAETGETPLMTAVRAGNVTVVKALIASGADVNANGGGRDQTPLMWAVARQQPAIVQVLLENGADIKVRSRLRPEYVSFGRGDPQGGRLNGKADGTLTSDGTRPGVRWIQKGGFTPFLFAAQRGDLESAKLLLAAGADINDRIPVGDTALMLAIHNDHASFAAFLLDKGADPNATGAGYTALHMAVARILPDTVTALLAHGANPNTQLTKGEPFVEGIKSQLPEYLLGATPILLAAALQEVDTMKALMAAGADAKLSMTDGTTTLMAAMGIHPGMLGFGPFEKVTSVGYADATYRGSRKIKESDVLEAVKLAFESGVDVNAARVGGVRYHGANPRTRVGRGDGDTALHTATADKLASVVEYLVSHGAKLNGKDQWGLTPLAMAQQKPWPEGIGLIGSGAEDGGGLLGDEATAALLKRLGATE